mmetsp:Transcript_86670/g.245311  ORF Transcript_86670/g.245311 Transcript_86670/m.245311 type:complete len:255 (-) Transcript_86670:485-1249(-)
MICNRRAALSSNFHSVVPALTTTTLLTILNRQRSDPPRSSVTWPTIEQRLLEPLRGTGTPVDIFAFHVVPDPAIVDGVKIDLNVSRLIPAQYYEEMNQSAVDQLIADLPLDAVAIWTGKRSPLHNLNNMRQLFAERMVGKMIRDSGVKYDTVVISGPDYYYPIDLDAKKSIEFLSTHPKNVLAVNTNDAMGYTNGFYMGRPDDLLPILTDRWDRFVRLSLAPPALSPPHNDNATCARARARPHFTTKPSQVSKS